jgi:polyhydroxyalkanoate synthase
VVFETLLRRSEQLARVQANRFALRFVNGIEWAIRDAREVVGRTPYDVILRRDKLEVRRYHAGSTKPTHALPVLLVPPLMVKPFIFDLYPGRSLVASLLQRGFDVYLVDFGEPDAADAYVTLENYVLDWMPAAAEAVKLHSGSNELSMLGYCMGGLFALSHVAANRDDSVRNIVAIGAPIDFAQMGMLAWVAKNAGDQVEAIARRVGNIPGGLSSIGFRLMSPMKNVTRYADLFINLWSDEYVNGFDAMNQWVAQFIDYPQGAFLQFYEEFVRHNKLVRGELRLGDRTANLRHVGSSILAFAGDSDQVATVAASRAIMKAVGGTDKEFVVVPGGHMGVFAGSRAPELVWKPTADWLAPRSHAKSPARERKAERPSTLRATAPAPQASRTAGTKRRTTQG